MFLHRARCFGVIGICIGLISIFFGLSWEYIFYKIVEKLLTIRPNSFIFDLWHAPPTVITTDFYMFNWTNPQDFRNPSIKPKFEELGPYRFFETQEKLNFVWHAHNASVSYTKRSIYRFDEKGSRGSLNDTIVTINSVAVAVATLTQGLSYAPRMLAEMAMIVYPRDLILKKSVAELLFAGFPDTILSATKAIPMSGLEIPFDKYGYLYGRNDSTKYYGNFNVYTGGNNISDIGHVYTWNNKNYSAAFPRQCSKICGSAGEFQGPNLRINGTVNIFMREFCRDILLEFESEAEVDGVRGFRYVGGGRAIDNGTLYSDNACLCNGECLPSGVMNVSTCWYGSPIFISYPHFYNADPHYLSQMEGLKPSKKKHEFSYTIEPKTSVGLHIMARTQVNILVQPIPRSRLFHDVRKIMFPLFWAEATTSLTPDILDYFRLIEKIILYGHILAVVFGVFGLITATMHPVIERLRQNILQNFCAAKLGDVVDTSMDIEDEVSNDSAKSIDDDLFFKSLKTWKEVEHYEISETSMSPSIRPLLT